MAKRSDEHGPAPDVVAENIIIADKASQAAGHVAARKALVELILADARWAEELAGWVWDLKIFPAARDLREASDQASRSRAENRLREVFDTLEGTGILEEKVERFVQNTLRLPYPWLAADLHLWFQQHVLAWAYHEDREMLYEVRTLELVRPAPRISVRFRTKRGETLDELAERWRGINAEVEKALITLAPAPASPDGDRMPKNEGEHIRQYVGWFYRTHTKATSVRALAKEHHRQRHQEIFKKDGDCRCRRAADGTFVAPDDRPAIYAGILQAKGVLALDVIGVETPDSDTN